MRIEKGVLVRHQTNVWCKVVVRPWARAMLMCGRGVWLRILVISSVGIHDWFHGRWDTKDTQLTVG